MREQSAATNDLIDGLAEGDGGPLVLAALARPLEHPGHPVGIVGALVRGLALGAEAGVDQGRGRGRLGHVQVGMEIEGVVGVAVDLDCHAVEDFHLDAAAGVAVQADRVEGVLRLEQFVGLGLGQLTGLDPGNEVAGEIEMADHNRAAAGQGRRFQEIAAGHGGFVILCHRAPPAFRWRRNTPAARFSRPA